MIVIFLKRKTPPNTISTIINIRRGQAFFPNYLILSPFSVKYLIAPGCKGMGDPPT